jgi:hypothetical protein
MENQRNVFKNYEVDKTSVFNELVKNPIIVEILNDYEINKNKTDLFDKLSNIQEVRGDIDIIKVLTNNLEENIKYFLPDKKLGYFDRAFSSEETRYKRTYNEELARKYLQISFFSKELKDIDKTKYMNAILDILSYYYEDSTKERLIKNLTKDYVDFCVETGENANHEVMVEQVFNLYPSSKSVLEKLFQNILLKNDEMFKVFLNKILANKNKIFNVQDEFNRTETELLKTLKSLNCYQEILIKIVDFIKNQNVIRIDIIENIKDELNYNKLMNKELVDIILTSKYLDLGKVAENYIAKKEKYSEELRTSLRTLDEKISFFESNNIDKTNLNDFLLELLEVNKTKTSKENKENIQKRKADISAEAWKRSDENIFYLDNNTDFIQRSVNSHVFKERKNQNIYLEELNSGEVETIAKVIVDLDMLNRFFKMENKINKILADKEYLKIVLKKNNYCYEYNYFVNALKDIQGFNYFLEKIFLFKNAENSLLITNVIKDLIKKNKKIESEEYLEKVLLFLKKQNDLEEFKAICDLNSDLLEKNNNKLAFSVLFNFNKEDEYFSKLFDKNKEKMDNVLIKMFQSSYISKMPNYLIEKIIKEKGISFSIDSLNGKYSVESNDNGVVVDTLKNPQRTMADLLIMIIKRNNFDDIKEISKEFLNKESLLYKDGFTVNAKEKIEYLIQNIIDKEYLLAIKEELLEVNSTKNKQLKIEKEIFNALIKEINSNLEKMIKKEMKENGDTKLIPFIEGGKDLQKEKSLAILDGLFCKKENMVASDVVEKKEEIKSKKNSLGRLS